MTVVDTLSRLFKQKVHVQKGGEEILVFCPNCKHHKRKLNINTKTGFYQCGKPRGNRRLCGHARQIPNGDTSHNKK